MAGIVLVVIVQVMLLLSVVMESVMVLVVKTT
jgi:hypothetical protein